MGYVKKVAREWPLQAGFCSRRFNSWTNLDKTASGNDVRTNISNYIIITYRVSQIKEEVGLRVILGG